MDFATHMQLLAEEFIGTVLFVDDQISVKINTNANAGEINKLKDSLHGAEPLDEPNVANSGKANSDEDHLLKIRELSVAFAEKGILCSPIHTNIISTVEQQNDLVYKISKLSNKADVIVLDWALEDPNTEINNGTTARRIIEKLKSDNKDREVLVYIFSAENAEQIDVLSLSEDHVRVFYASKNVSRAYETLPEKICKTFSEIYSGLMPAAALSAIKVIRDNTHRILSLYSSDHDPAYLSHRCLLPRPEDAEVFATELMAATFDDLMRGNESITKNLCCGVLAAWVDSKCLGFPDKDLEIKRSQVVKVNNEIRKQWLEIGIIKWMHTNLTANPGIGSDKKAAEIEKWERNTAKSVGEYFSNEHSVEEGAQAEFTRQASFARLTSHAFADAINNNASTFLSLGSILKSDSQEYYMCIQPLCDSVRLKSGYNKFLLLKLEQKKFNVSDVNNRRFHLLVTDGESNDIYLKVSEDVSNIDLFLFVASTGNDKVIMKIGETVHGKQNETTDITFTFLAQLRSSQAQRIAMRFLHKLTRIGLDESEWLRRHGTTM